MNKFVKGGVATGAGVLLLLGGAGTFMFWDDDTQVGKGTITAGSVSLEATSDGVWKNATGEIITNMASYQVSPGEKLTYSQDVYATVEGEELTAQLSLDKASVTAVATSDSSVPAANQQLENYIEQHANVELRGGNAFQQVGENTYRISTPDSGTDGVDHGQGSLAATVVVTVGFPDSGIEGYENTAMEGQVQLNALNVSLTQVTEPTIPPQQDTSDVDDVVASGGEVWVYEMAVWMPRSEFEAYYGETYEEHMARYYPGAEVRTR